LAHVCFNEYVHQSNVPYVCIASLAVPFPTDALEVDFLSSDILTEFDTAIPQIGPVSNPSCELVVDLSVDDSIDDSTDPLNHLLGDIPPISLSVGQLPIAAAQGDRDDPSPQPLWSSKWVNKGTPPPCLGHMVYDLHRSPSTLLYKYAAAPVFSC
jgi:hypothetical protein